MAGFILPSCLAIILAIALGLGWSFFMTTSHRGWKPGRGDRNGACPWTSPLTVPGAPPPTETHPNIVKARHLVKWAIDFPTRSRYRGAVLPSSSTAIQFTVLGSPRTKKNHGVIIRVRGKPRLIPSRAWTRWVKGAVVLPRVAKLIDQPYNCAALFYRDRDTGDAVGYQQGLADALEKWNILSNDKYLVSWDGTRLLLDRAKPRVEVTLTPATN